MYQTPVGSVEKIRKTRKKVKTILSEFGLEDCQNRIMELSQEKTSEDNVAEDNAFDETEWVDFTDGFNGKLTKKWPYRTRELCCMLCKYSSRNIYNFRSHISRYHSYVKSVCDLVPCSHCNFIGNPMVVKKHVRIFHSEQFSHRLAAREGTLPTHRGHERYHCRRCGYPSSSIFGMKKHVILKHLENVAQQYIGYRLQPETGQKAYCCKVCKAITGTLDYMLHHMLVDPKHYAVNIQIQNLIGENKNYVPNTASDGKRLLASYRHNASKTGQPQTVNGSLLLTTANGQQAEALVTLQQQQGNPRSATLICTPGTNQAFLPPQASALVQLASAEAKGLLQPGATIALQSTLPQGAPIVQFPSTSVSLKPAPLTPSPPGQLPHIPPSQQISLQPTIQVNMTGSAASITQSAAVQKLSTNQQNHKLSTDQITPQGTMLTSQSLLSHLIPTGNKVNGMPTYTFAPLQVTMQGAQSTSTPLKPVEHASNVSLQAKKWITCPLCNELFPSNVYDIHTEAAHKSKPNASKSDSLAARAPFLKKMPDKSIKCLLCKVIVSENKIVQHLLHGLKCLYCSTMFFNIKQLIEHIQEHNPTGKAYCDLLKRDYRLNTSSDGKLLFPYFDVNVTAPKEVLQHSELNITLVTNCLQPIFVKLLPSIPPDICQTAERISSAYCSFCDEKFQNSAKHLQHLKQKHFVAPTIHAILKTEAFKCIYCNGVYTGKVTQQAVMLHLQRCRCSPNKQVPSKSTSDTTQSQPQLPPLQRQPQRQPQRPPQPQRQLQLQPAPKPMGQIIHPPGLYFLQLPQAPPLKPMLAPSLTTTLTPTALPNLVQPLDPPETEAELQSKRRLEEAWKQVVENNRREREERAAMRKKREQDRLAAQSQPQPEPQSDPSVKLVLEPTVTERRSNEERKEFISKYFHINPYINKSETDELCKRLSLTKAELAAYFGNKRSKCMKSIKRNTASVLLGFNMTELGKLKHNLLIPEIQTPELQVAMNHTGSEPMEESGSSESTDLGEMDGIAESRRIEENKMQVDENVDLCLSK